MSKHTPLPWQADGEVVYTTVGEDETVADCWEASDAEFIVRACNAHDELLAACKAMQIVLRSGPTTGKDLSYELGLARAAIAKAEGECKTCRGLGKIGYGTGLPLSKCPQCGGKSDA